MRTLKWCSVILLASSCQADNPMTEREKAQVINEVTTTLNNYYQDIKTSGLLAELNYLDSSADFFWVPPGYSNALSYDSVVSILRRNAGSIASIDNSFDTLAVVPVNIAFAVYTARLRSVVRDTKGKENIYVMMETGVVLKRADGWKLLSGQTGVVE